jgi:hypothetical protein
MTRIAAAAVEIHFESAKHIELFDCVCNAMRTQAETTAAHWFID